MDAVARLPELDLAGAAELGRLAPFGCANSEPLIALRAVTARACRVVGQGHLLLTLCQGEAVGDAIGFGLADQAPAEGQAVDVIGVAELNTFRGTRRARVRVNRFVPLDAASVTET